MYGIGGMSHIYSFNNENQTKGQLFLGSVYDIDNMIINNKNQIFGVLSVCGDDGSKVALNKSKYQHLELQASDHPNFKINTLFQISFKFLDEQLASTNVVVHCFAGVSRSATVVVAYLMKRLGITLEQSLALVKENRSIICPNKGFLEQLRKFEIENQKAGEVNEQK